MALLQAPAAAATAAATTSALAAAVGMQVLRALVAAAVPVGLFLRGVLATCGCLGMRRGGSSSNLQRLLLELLQMLKQAVLGCE